MRRAGTWSNAHVLVDTVRRLAPRQVVAVLDLADAATAADGVPPLSEHTLLQVRHGGQGEHLLVYAGTKLAGYAHLDRAAGANAAELVVHPAHRRRGVGAALVAAVQQDGRPVRLWSHGHLRPAREFAARAGYPAVRELWQMRRRLGPDAPPLPPFGLPPGFTARTFVPGRDEAAWVEVNARAFAEHPEQGRLTVADVQQREAEEWFDPQGFFLVLDGAADGGADGGADGAADGGPLAAFHWTKVHPAAAPATGAGEASGAVGEVYAVGVHPAYQGRGLGRAVTVLGLRHLAGKGLAAVMLYVEADNSAAVATYRRLGFTRSAVDVVYASATAPGAATLGSVHPGVSR